MSVCIRPMYARNCALCLQSVVRQSSRCSVQFAKARHGKWLWATFILSRKKGAAKEKEEEEGKERKGRESVSGDEARKGIDL